MGVEHLPHIPPLELPSEEDRQHIRSLCRMAGIKEIEQAVIIKFIVEGDSLRDIGKDIKLSKSRVHQILHKAFERLRGVVPPRKSMV
jgi:DNA-directed RNA polymerase specialized sigma subunit